MIKMNIGDNYDWFFKEVEVYEKYSGNSLSSIRLVGCGTKQAIIVLSA